MTDYYLRFDQEPENAGDLASNSEVLVDVIGDLCERGTYDEEGNEITPPSLIPGWHVNLRIDGELPDELKEFEVFPENPMRVWA
jgi:hypothetical protein